MKISALIMAGGDGRRMGGQDKGLMEWHGKALIDHIAENLRTQVADIAISANRNIEAYAAHTPIVFADARQWQGLGPLAALGTAASDVRLTTADWLLVVPCDTPNLPDDLVISFLMDAQDHPATAAFYAETDIQPHYSVMFVRPRLLRSTAGYLSTGMRTLHGWLEQQRARPVHFPHEAAFANFNTLHDMENHHVRF